MLKKGNLLVLAMSAALIAGCGGGGFFDFHDDSGSTSGGSSSGGSSSGGGGISRNYPTFNLSQNGIVQVTFLSGLSRRATGSQVAVINAVEFQNDDGERIPGASQGAFPELSVVLDEYRINTGEIVVNFDGTRASQMFTEFPLQIAKLKEIQSDGTAQDLPIAGSPVFAASQPFDVDMTVVPGRYTGIQVRLDQEIVKYNSTTGLIFDEDKFQAFNYDFRGSMPTFFSDYLAFDLNATPAGDRPFMSNGQVADRVYFSGDGIAISRGVGSTSKFELLAPIAIQSGTIQVGPTIGGRKANNTYLLTDSNPSSSTETALTGVWKPHTDVVSPGGDITMIAFPKSDDGASQQLVIYKQANGSITAMWQGQVDYSDDATSGTFKLFPVSTVDNAIPVTTETVTGTVSGLVTQNGAVMRGNWQVSGTTPGSWVFGTSGGFATYRR